jgi:hypothetical protein
MTWRLLFGAGVMLFMFRELLHGIVGLGGGFPVILIGMRGGFNLEGVRRGGNMIFRLKWIGDEL